MRGEKDIRNKYRSSTHYILSALLPYTEANMKLAFKPNKFFNDLEKLDGLKAEKRSIKANYYRLIKTGFVKLDDKGKPFLSKKARKKLMTRKPKKLDGNKKILIAFDIPEAERNKRDGLRALLKQLEFKQIQLSVWETDYDYRDYLKSEIQNYDLEKYVSMYESLRIKT